MQCFELISDIEMSNFIDIGLKGGVSSILDPYVKASDLKCPDFDPKLPIYRIKYLDAKKLYIWDICQFLPSEGFEWVSQKKIY